MSGPAPATGDVASTMREMWATRPPRRDSDRRIAGVAGAIARRYAIDPTLVRVALVVLAVTGGGLLLYVAGWIALPPDPSDPPHRDRGRHPHGRGHGPVDGRPHRRPARQGPPPPVIVLGVVVALATLGPALAGRVQTLVGLVVAAVLLYTLHTGRAHLGEPGGAPAATPPGDTRVSLEKDAGTPPPAGPPAWDPLGAAPFAWDLPEPSTPPGPAPRRSVLTPVTLALALIAAGAVGAATLAGLPGASITATWAAALGVVGLGLLVGGLRGSGRGLLVAAVPLLLLTVVSATAGTVADRFDPDGSGPGGFGPGGFGRGAGDVTAAPTAAALVAPGYRTGLGDIDLDLRGVGATVSGPVRSTVSSGAGDITVTVPATADVTVTCRSGVGDVDCLGRDDDGTVVDTGSDGPGGPQFDLTVESGAGDLEVTRG